MKKNCYIYWDNDEVPRNEQKIYIQCEECFKKNRKGFIWGASMLYGHNEIKCSLCHTIIYKRERKKKNENKTSI